MLCKINAVQTEIVGGKTVADMLREKEVSLETVVVEYNGEILKREFFDKKMICEGDNIEVLSFVGGG